MTIEKKAFRKLVTLGSKGDAAPYSYSPNDVLVQIALPLILILAIATRLMMVQQAIQADNQDGEIILDLWKQQFILRIDKVLSDWEQVSGLTAYPSFENVQWHKGWPEDKGFKTLCDQGQGLNHAGVMRTNLYRRVLAYQSDSSTTEGSVVKWPLFDPSIQEGEAKPEGLPDACVIDRDKREWGMRHIEERCSKWKQQLEELQWNTVDSVISQLPAENDIADRDLSRQMAKLAQELQNRGYPLLFSVSEEYISNTGAPDAERAGQE